MPAEIAGTIARALAKAPADRFSPAGQFAEALTMPQAVPRPVERPPATVPASVRGKRNVIAYAAMAVLAIVGAYTVISRTEGTPDSSVLPYNDLPERSGFAIYVASVAPESRHALVVSITDPYLGTYRPNRRPAGD